ncbi:MAG: DUF1684 domain-containing protein [Flavobacteriaceae bacterium]|nr:DUF1684 domain-containing protein [Flavobacteriaceae bacterium]
MKRIPIYILLLMSVFGAWAQTDAELIAEIEVYRYEENEKFLNEEESPLDKKALRKFKALDFYPIDLAYRVKAKFVRTPGEKPFLMPTSTSRLPEYVKYGEAHFSLQGKELMLNLYKFTGDYGAEGYENYLFLPFTDLTSGDGSYGGGRYIEAWIPEGDSIIIDFNKAYNPYCAYSKDYSCPIPPKENDLLVRVEAGVKDYKAY